MEGKYQVKPTDRRILRTRKLLSEALVSLTIEKGYDEVTIQEITDQADIGYRTFFRHYEDKDALLLDVLHTTLSEVRRLMRFPSAAAFTAPGFEGAPAENGRILFEHVRANCDLYRVLLRSGPVALEPVQGFACQEAQERFAAISKSAVPLEIVANHIVTAIFSMIRWWLDNDMPYSPEQMGQYAAELILLPARQVAMNQKSTPA
jgi:AcrR family transcriptional regulator